MVGKSPQSAADKTLIVLEALADHARIADIAGAAGLPKPTVHRILQTLVQHGFARSDGQGNYVCGPRILSLAGRFLQRLDIAEQVRPILRDLQERTGWTVHLALLSGDEAVYVAKVEGAKPYHLASRVGMSLKLHCTSIGKAILATMSDDQVAEIAARAGLPARTQNTITDAPALLSELAAVRARRYAEDHEENEAGVRAVGAAVFDHTGGVIGGLSAAALVHLAPVVEDLPAQVTAAAEAVSKALGAH
ncbi:IclR family transcriptional regulator [Kibdelosporangium aridum]|uniref:IclR family transcriptional regulator n=2 Tax=Pseudonocardiaceae TaxID=2070 RepID=A0A428ZIW7_KIBAR|nr:IclR family transcriptional regulator [Kibdelosporangium aridum]RSM88029.1 IclR family transcriptional regulator [Kibdelosporangium aridum]CAB45040.1 putative transcriptional regulator [Amycolatopsis orientalis]